MPTRLLICGDRAWTDYPTILAKLSELCQNGQRPEVVIHGNARGAEDLAGRAAAELGIPIQIYHADWGTWGRVAELKQNRDMLEKGKPTLVWAFMDPTSPSSDAHDMIGLANGSNISWTIFSCFSKQEKQDD